MTALPLRLFAWLGLLAFWGGGGLCAELPAAKPLGLPELQTELSNHLAQARFAAAAWGVKVVSLDSGQTIFEHNAGKLLKPASNAKLYTGALALDKFGPDYRIKTAVYTTANPNAGVVNGDLIVFGRGDPSMAARFREGDHKKALLPLVEAIVKSGLKTVQGDLVGDESFFTGPPFGSGWNWDDLQYYYGAEVSALSQEDNVVDLQLLPGNSVGEACQIVASPRTSFLTFENHLQTAPKGARREVSIYRPVGENVVHLKGRIPLGDPGVVDSVSVHRPALWFVTMLRDQLAQSGVQVLGKVRTLDWTNKKETPTAPIFEVAAVESAPLGEILAKMLKPSQNLYAQLLLLQVGARAPFRPDQTTEEAGLAELKNFLASAGVKKGEALLEDGSGLGRSSLVTANATVALLKHMSSHRHAQTFIQALPVAGVDGTLKARMREPGVFKNVRAKTGSLRHVNTLSGYLTTAAGERLAFSILLNNNANPEAKVAADVDAIPALLVRLDQAGK